CQGIVHPLHFRPRAGLDKRYAGELSSAGHLPLLGADALVRFGCDSHRTPSHGERLTHACGRGVYETCRYRRGSRYWYVGVCTRAARAWGSLGPGRCGILPLRTDGLLDGALWGQTDGVISFLVLLALLCAVRQRPVWAGILF